MGINITKWKTKRMVNLSIPLKALYDSERKDWHPKQPIIINAETSEIELKCGCDQSIRGILKDGDLFVTKFDMTGDGSGSFLYYVLKDALKQSKGELRAVIVWESGDISSLNVSDGLVEDENIEL